MTEHPFQHRPVMIEEILTLFEDIPSGTMVDATLGGAGHAEALLEAHPGNSLLGIDRDPAALAAASARLARFGDRVHLVHARFDQLAELMTDLSLAPASSVLFDLGVSSPQLDVAERGFSYRAAGPVDMRMDTTQQWSATDVVNGYTHAELVRVLRNHGDERFASRIAAAIIAARPIDSTADLAEIVRTAIPAAARRHGGHPAKRTFQAIRIEVNRELEILEPALDAAIKVLQPGGRLAVLTYHSGEDRIAKSVLRRAATGGCTCPAGLPCVCGAVSTVRLIRAGGTTPTEAERTANRRAESARLRAAERLGD